MAAQSVKGIHMLFYPTSSGCYKLCPSKLYVKGVTHSFQKPLFCRYGETKTFRDCSKRVFGMRS